MHILGMCCLTVSIRLPFSSWVYWKCSSPTLSHVVSKKGVGSSPGGSVVKNLLGTARDGGSIPDLGRSDKLQNN